MNYFNQDAENVLRELGSDREKGLTTSQADESRIKNGENAITEEKTKSNSL
ncbi:MAG: cation-transporting P-type ATPase, partial [Ruminococcus flavefaciens]|nr:cation-transporting P-type ATPase [Ruminococcus flavefaciens]